MGDKFAFSHALDLEPPKYADVMKLVMVKPLKNRDMLGINSLKVYSKPMACQFHQEDEEKHCLVRDVLNVGGKEDTVGV